MVRTVLIGLEEKYKIMAPWTGLSHSGTLCCNGVWAPRQAPSERAVYIQGEIKRQTDWRRYVNRRTALGVECVALCRHGVVATRVRSGSNSACSSTLSGPYARVTAKGCPQSNSAVKWNWLPMPGLLSTQISPPSSPDRRKYPTNSDRDGSRIRIAITNR